MWTRIRAWGGGNVSESMFRTAKAGGNVSLSDKGTGYRKYSSANRESFSGCLRFVWDRRELNGKVAELRVALQGGTELPGEALSNPGIA